MHTKAILTGMDDDSLDGSYRVPAQDVEDKENIPIGMQRIMDFVDFREKNGKQTKSMDIVTEFGNGGYIHVLMSQLVSRNFLKKEKIGKFVVWSVIKNK